MVLEGWDAAWTAPRFPGCPPAHLEDWPAIQGRTKHGYFPEKSERSLPHQLAYPPRLSQLVLLNHLQCGDDPPDSVVPGEVQV